MPLPARSLIRSRAIAGAILLIRGHKILLDRDLALLYGVEVRALNQAVKRNRGRFPADFAFRLTRRETADLKSQSVISSSARHGGSRRSPPMAFTEQGVAMLSGVLNSRRAIAVNVEIMRAFVRLRRILTEHAELARRLDELESKYDANFSAVFDAIRQLIAAQDAETDAEARREPIGFKTSSK